MQVFTIKRPIGRRVLRHVANTPDSVAKTGKIRAFMHMLHSGNAGLSVVLWKTRAYICLINAEPD